MIDLREFEVRADPFPHIIAEDLLRASDLDDLVAEWPADELFDRSERIMGGRRRIASPSREFRELMRSSNAWRRFDDFLNSDGFCRQLISTFAEWSAEFGCELDVDAIPFSPTFMRRHSPGQNALVTSVRNRFERLTRALHLSNQEKLYLHLDISSAQNGYEREIHHDNPNRLVAFVIYFSDAAESEGQGGEFVIHRHRTKKPYAEYERQPDPADTTVHETLTPKRGLGLVFLSTRNSYHSVPTLTGATKCRKFIYGGLSVASPRKLWK